MSGAGVGIASAGGEPNYKGMDVRLLFQLSQEYYNHAKAVFHKVKSERQLQQYYTLIQQSLKCLTFIKTNPLMLQKLNLKEDLCVTLQLAEMLTEHTHNSEQLAISYLENFKNRLLNLKHDVDDLMMIEFMLVCIIPLNTTYSEQSLAIALKKCNKLLKKLYRNNEDQLSVSKWCLIFKFAKIQLTLTHNSVSSSTTTSLCDDTQVIEMYEDLLSEIPQAQYPIFHDYVMLSCTTLKLENNHCIEVLHAIPPLLTQDLPMLQCWWQLVEICRAIKVDENIYDNLDQFVKIFKKYKHILNELNTFRFSQDIFPQLAIQSCMFNSFNLKKILLLLQSVSFMLNHHDPAHSHSLAFLPKLLKSGIEAPASSNLYSPSLADSNHKLGTEIMDLTKYYSMWQFRYLKPKSESPVELQSFHPTASPDMEYMDILKEPDVLVRLSFFEQFVTRQDINHELRTFGSINLYLLYCITNKLDHLSELEKKIEQNVLVQQNPLIKCLFVLVWNMTHFKPFMETPIFCFDNELKNEKLLMLQKFLEVNVLKTNTTDMSYKIKKSQLCFLLLQYVGGKILVNETERQTRISQNCFHLATHCENVTLDLAYIIGLWCFNNSILLSDQKQELRMKLKLKKIVKKYENNNKIKKPSHN